ncbi:MAG: NAD(P)H-dependent oxidoreductase, partial [Synergistaceae bacterium]|nr:NAD(P)H-dependent oxidoreductase [Synergistaceae bacterium]
MEYPDWKFDVEREQNRLRNADVIVIQFPFFWSGTPGEMYQAGGIQGYPVDDFLIPLKQFAAACGMVWTGYIYSG